MGQLNALIGYKDINGNEPEQALMNTNAAVSTLPGQSETVTDAPENEYSPIDLKYNMNTCGHLRACLIILRSSSSDPHPQTFIPRFPF